jgi:hypothetical protein
MFPAYFLSSYVLGVRRDGPVQNKTLLIEPRLGDLTEAAGTVVTEFGPVPVSWETSRRPLELFSRGSRRNQNVSAPSRRHGQVHRDSRRQKYNFTRKKAAGWK